MHYSCHRTAFTLFQLISGGKDLTHLVMSPYAFPIASSLDFTWSLWLCFLTLKSNQNTIQIYNQKLVLINQGAINLTF